MTNNTDPMRAALEKARDLLHALNHADNWDSKSAAAIITREIDAALASAPPTRDATIEECARIAEETSYDGTGTQNYKMGCDDTANQIAEALRALKSPPAPRIDDEGMREMWRACCSRWAHALWGDEQIALSFGRALQDKLLGK